MAAFPGAKDPGVRILAALIVFIINGQVFADGESISFFFLSFACSHDLCRSAPIFFGGARSRCGGEKFFFVEVRSPFGAPSGRAKLERRLKSRKANEVLSYTERLISQYCLKRLYCK